MPDTVILGPDGNEYVFPEGTSVETMRAAMRKRFPPPKPAKETGKPSGRLGAFGAGIGEAIPRVIGGIIEFFDPQGRKLLTPQQQAAYQRQFEGARQQRPNAFAAGQIAGEVLATAPIVAGGGKAIEKLGGGLVRVAPRAGAAASGVARAGRVTQRVGRAVQTGGIGSGRTAAQTTAMGRGARLGQLAERMAGGAIAGGAGAGLVGQDIREGAVFGAGLPVVASVLKRMGGGIADITKLPRQKAAEIIRKALADNVDAARAAFADLAPDDKRLAEQVLIEAGIEPDPFFGIGKAIQEQTVSGATPMRQALESQAAAREARLAEAAGGPDMESIRAAERQGRQAVTEAMKPIREAMYGRAGVASRVVPEIEAQAAAAGQRAAEQSAQARRFAFGAERAETALGQMDDLGDAFAAEAIARQRGLAGAMGQRSEAAARGAIAARQEAQDLYDIVDDLAAQGMEPMRAADLIGSLRQKMRDPEILAGSMEERVIKNVIRQIEKGTDTNGMLNPRTLGKIRRSGLNEIVKRLSTQMTGGPSRTGTPEAAQDVVLDLRNMIDDTLSRGGAGDLVYQFIQGSERGYAAVNRQRLAGEALRLYKDARAEFDAMMRGDRPEVVSKFMMGGPEKETIAGAFAGDPARLAALQQSAREMKTLNRMADLRLSGAGPAGKIMVTATPTRMSRGLATLAGIPYTPLGFAARGGQQVEQAFMAPRVERELAQAYLSGPAMAELLSTTPGKARISEQVSKLPPSVRNAMAQLLRGYYLGPPPENNYSQ